MTTYIGSTLLDLTPDVDTKGATDHTRRFGAFVENPSGVFGVAWGDRYQAWTKTFRYVCRSRAEIATLKSFLAERAGRYLPCWVPTWNDDLVLTVVPDSLTSSITALHPGPSGMALLGTSAARHVAIIPPGADGIYGLIVAPMSVGAATDNGDGTVLVRTDAVYFGPTFPAASYRVSLLKFARLDTDSVALDYSVPGVVTAVLPFVELPYETPGSFV